MKASASLPLLSVALVGVMATFFFLPIPSTEKRVWIDLPVAENGWNSHWTPSLYINVKEDGTMVDFDGVSLNRDSLGARLADYSESTRARGYAPSVTVRAHRSSEVRAIRLVYDEAVAAGFADMKFRVHLPEPTSRTRRR